MLQECDLANSLKRLNKYQKKRQMGHIAHLRNQLKSINKFEQSYDYIYIIKLAQ